jgi:hypothetical protein
MLYYDMLSVFNPLNAELNPICHLLALVAAHHILHFSRVRVKSVNADLSIPEKSRRYWKAERRGSFFIHAIFYSDSSVQNLSVDCMPLRMAEMLEG